MPHKHILRHVRNALVAVALLFGVLAASSANAQAAPAAPAVASVTPAFVAPLGATYTLTDVVRKFKLRSSAGAWPTCASSSNRRDAVCYALKQIGDPYCWGGDGPGCFDCSGLVVAGYYSTGVSLPHYSGALRDRSRWVPRSEAWMGDIAYEPGHVALVLGKTADGKVWVVEAPHTGSYVRVRGLRSTEQVRRLRL